MKKTMIVIMIILVSFKLAYANSILQVARAEIGRGETKGDNQGPDIRRYGANGMPWCAAFTSYVLQKSDIKTFPYYLSAISYYKTAKGKGLVVNKPRPGDLIVFWRVCKNPLVHGHIGIVEKVEGNKITTIEGNTGKFPSKVKRIVYQNKPKNLLGYIRLAKIRLAKNG